MMFRYFKGPFRFVEPENDQDVRGPRIEDANGGMVVQLLWPGHTVEETEQAEQETYWLGRSLAAIMNARAQPSLAKWRRTQYRSKEIEMDPCVTVTIKIFDDKDQDTLFAWGAVPAVEQFSKLIKAFEDNLEICKKEQAAVATP